MLFALALPDHAPAGSHVSTCIDPDSRAEIATRLTLHCRAGSADGIALYPSPTAMEPGLSPRMVEGAVTQIIQTDHGTMLGARYADWGRTYGWFHVLTTPDGQRIDYWYARATDLSCELISPGDVAPDISIADAADDFCDHSRFQCESD